MINRCLNKKVIFWCIAFSWHGFWSCYWFTSCGWLGFLVVDKAKRSGAKCLRNAAMIGADYPAMSLKIKIQIQISWVGRSTTMIGARLEKCSRCASLKSWSVLCQAFKSVAAVKTEKCWTDPKKLCTNPNSWDQMWTRATPVQQKIKGLSPWTLSNPAPRTSKSFSFE